MKFILPSDIGISASRGKCAHSYPSLTLFPKKYLIFRRVKNFDTDRS